MAAEWQKMQLNPDTYRRFLSAEMLMVTKDGFHVCQNIRNMLAAREALEIAADMDEELSKINSEQGDEKTWKRFLRLVDKYRARNFQQQQWRAQNMAKAEELLRARLNKMPSILAKQRRSSYVETQKLARIRDENRPKDAYAAHVLRRYLKYLQLQNKIPVPQRLPYTPMDPAYTESAPPAGKVLPGSTKMSAISSGYDQEYIESIVVPGLEYDINWHHHMASLRSIVEEKGPYKVKIQSTSAGPRTIPYIRMPFNRPEPMKLLAMLIKKSMTMLRMERLLRWESGDEETEVKNSDGTYSIRGSKGFGPDERMRKGSSCSYDSQLDVTYEHILTLQQGFRSNLPQLLKWSRDWVSDAIQAMERQRYRLGLSIRRLVTKGSPLFDDQAKLQQQQFEHYIRQTNRYNTIVRQLNQDRVFKHSELVNGSTVEPENVGYSTKYNSKTGTPRLERVGMGKALGDYLEQNGYHYFKWGMKFDKRFRFK